MTPKTSLEYQKLAKHFLTTKIQGDLTIDNIKSALIELAPQYRPAYWRRLRCAIHHTLVFYGETEAASIIREVQNPVTTNTSGNTLHKKPKQRRVKQVRQDEHILLLRYCKSRYDAPLLGALHIAWLLGCRPAEMPHIRLLDNYRVFIPSAKKTSNGLRGKDRTLRLKRKSYEHLEGCLAILHQEFNSNNTDEYLKGIHRIQRRLQTATKKLWPRRKHRISLYSYRHQMGSDLKASRMSSEAVALVMGHQSIKSVEKYGNRRLSAVRILPAPNITNMSTSAPSL